ncbi:MAG TPA: caspase family protein [Thermoleophilaceae bacterium]|jgi:hypothetical protein
MRRWALLVGINDYEDPGVKDLRGCVGDVALIRGVLTSRGFVDADITQLLDREATRARILHELSELADRASGDDQVFVYYSGHGSQARDVSGEEDDRWDETLVPCDSGRQDLPCRDIIDDELRVAVERLSARTGHVLLVIDSCHSGSVLRSISEAVASDADREIRWVTPDERGLDPEIEVTAPRDPRVEKGPSGWLPRDSSGHVLIAACRDEQVASETRFDGAQHGALTYHLCGALERPNTTLREAFEDAKKKVHEQFGDQDPQVEGPQTQLDAPPFASSDPDGGAVPDHPDGGGGGVVKTESKIARQPHAITVAEGEDATFTVRAFDPSATYQWKRDGSVIDGETGTSFTLAEPSVEDSGTTFTVDVSVDGTTETSSAAKLTVKKAQLAWYGSFATWTGIVLCLVGVAGGIALWKLTDSVLDQLEGAAKFGAVAALQLLLVGFLLALGAMYLGLLEFRGRARALDRRPVVEESDSTRAAIAPGDVAQAVATGFASLGKMPLGRALVAVAALLFVVAAVVTFRVLPSPANPTAPTVAHQPSDATVSEGGTAFFRGAATGTAPISYEWQLNGEPIAGQNKPTLTVKQVLPAQSGDVYTLVARNAQGEALSNDAKLTVQAKATP